MKIKQILKNQRGSISIIGIILTIIIVTIISGYASMNKNAWTTSELQSIVDMSSVNTLNNSIDEVKLKSQIFAIKGTNAYIDTTKSPMTVVTDATGVNTALANNFQKELNKQLGVNDMIVSIDVKKCVGTFSLTNWGTNGSDTSKSRPQLSLDAIVQVVIKNVSEFDSLGKYNISYKDAKTGNNMTISVDGVTKDGNVVLTVRTLSRVVYR